MSETTILVELLKQSPTIAALLLLVFKFLGALKEQRDECNADRAADRTARAAERTEFLDTLRANNKPKGDCE
jgi:hypothetical protein